LDGFLNAYNGDKMAAYRALSNAAQDYVTENGIKSGLFSTTLNVNGISVTMRGYISNGVSRISTAYTL
jgi:hypothetical protein